MLIDTHAHLNFNAYREDSDEVIRRTLAGGLPTGRQGMKIINVGSQYSTSQRAVEIAEKYPDGVYAAVGLHPIHAAEEEFNYEEYKKIALRGAERPKKVIAIGEIGLDYKLEYVSFKEKQKEIFLRQMDLAKELNLPVMIHCRQAHDELITALEHYNNITGVIHCFTGTWEQAEKYLEMGFYLGFNGIIFKLDLDEVIKKTPLDKILLETDCPYLTPLPAVALAQAGPQPLRNEPLYIKHVAQKVAELKGETFEKIAEITTQNARELFGIREF